MGGGRGQVTNVAAPKRPVGQMDGLGGLDWIDKGAVCGRVAPGTISLGDLPFGLQNTPCDLTHGSMWDKFAVGPPLIVHISDMADLAGLWWK